MLQHDQPIKSPNDIHREYKYIELNNKLSALLVSDSTAKQSSSALVVGVGSFSDPPNIPGIAHFLEHMLFMGSSKYPSENEYEKYLSEV